MLDSDGNLEWWNLAAENLLGLKTPQDGGQPVSNLIRHPRFKEYFDQEDYREPLEIPSPINERLRLQFHITLYGNREHLMLVRDVTRVHQLEQMRKDFVANVSHELRTPVARLRFGLEMIETAETDGARLKYRGGPWTTISRTSTSWSTRCSPTRAGTGLAAADLPAPGAGRAGAPGGGGDRPAAPRGAGQLRGGRAGA